MLFRSEGGGGGKDEEEATSKERMAENFPELKKEVSHYMSKSLWITPNFKYNK